MTIDKVQIKEILDRFMAGNTSEQEERLLTDYFCTEECVPEEWAAYAVLFRGFRKPASVVNMKPRRQHHTAKWIAVAASLLLLIGVASKLMLKDTEVSLKPEAVIAKVEVKDSQDKAEQPEIKAPASATVVVSAPQPIVRAVAKSQTVTETTQLQVEEKPDVELENNTVALLDINLDAVHERGDDLRNALAAMNNEVFENE